MTQKLTKYERKLQSQGAAKTGARLRSAARSQRMVGTTAALTAAKLDSALGEMSPSFPLPVVGPQKATTIVGALALANYALSKNPSQAASAFGYAGLALVCRAL